MQITLQVREGATMAPGEAVRIRCLAGTLWITNQGDSRDHVLDPGDSIDLPGARRHYLSSVGRRDPVSFEVCGTAARISVHRGGPDAAAAPPVSPGTIPGPGARSMAGAAPVAGPVAGAACAPASVPAYAPEAGLDADPPLARGWRGRMSALLALPARAAAWRRVSGGAGA